MAEVRFSRQQALDVEQRLRDIEQRFGDPVQREQKHAAIEQVARLEGRHEQPPAGLVPFTA